MSDIFRYDKAPEEVGISSEWILNIYKRLEKRKFLSHSVAVIRDAAVVGEGYYAPFQKNDVHRMYSTSKTFVATAIGMLIGEGKLSLDDRIVKFFPEYLPDPVPTFLAEATVRDLLVMSTPYLKTTYSFGRRDWVESFFKTKPVRPSGTYFNYDTSGSFILDVIVERLTGMPYMDYLYEVLLKDTGFTPGVRCVKSPDGYSWGGSGVLCTTLDLARLAQIYLDKGEVHGKQLLPRDFAEAAVSRQIDNNTTGHLDYAHGHGYGYQIWCIAEGCFAFLGMGGQLAMVCPRHRLVMATTSDEQGNATAYQYLFDLFFRELVEPLDENGGRTSLPANPDAYATLCEKQKHLACHLPLIGEPTSPYASEYLDKTYRFGDNPLGIEWLRVERRGDSAALVFFARGEEKEIAFGFGKYEIAPFPEKEYDGLAILEPMGRGYRTMSAALWTEERKLVVRSYLIDDYFGNMATTLSFKGDTLTVLMTKTAENFLGEYQGVAVGTLA